MIWSSSSLCQYWVLCRDVLVFEDGFKTGLLLQIPVLVSRILEKSNEGDEQASIITSVWSILTEEYSQQKHKGTGEVSHHSVYR